MSEASLTDDGTKGTQQERELAGVVLDGMYKLESRFSRGGMGEIWKARHTTLDTPWLVKLLPVEFAKNPAYIEALRREAKITAQLPGKFFPTVVHAGTSDGIAFLVMEALVGHDLGWMLREQKYKRGMTAAEALPLLEQILQAMAIAHSKGVIHRDIKPDNIFVEDVPDESPRIRILDFGVAKASSEVFATIGDTLPKGTQQYMPPEQFAPIPEPPTTAWDVFSIGLTAYQMICGNHPFAAGNYLERYKQGEELGPLHENKKGQRAGVNADIASVLQTAVRFDPEQRFADAGIMLEAFQAANTFRSEDIADGTIISESYRILGKLGAGGMGAVYNVEDIHHPADNLLLKIVTYPRHFPEEAISKLLERFRRECRILHNLEHPAISCIVENGKHLDYPFLVMEKAKGDTLGRLFHPMLSKGGWGAIITTAKQVASALDAVHCENIVHRDIKPSNIVVDPETGNAVVIDFGIAHLPGTQLTGRFNIGTAGFSSPEQMAGGAVGHASDQWSLAATFYAMITNITPGCKESDKDESTKSAMDLAAVRIASDKLPRLGDQEHLVSVPDSVVTAIEKAMSHNPEDRFATVTAFVEAMEEGVDDLAMPVFGVSNTEIELHKWAGGGKTTVIQLGQGGAKTENNDIPVLLTTPKIAAIVDAETENISHGKGGRIWPMIAIGCVVAVGVAYTALTNGAKEEAMASDTVLAIQLDASVQKTPLPITQPAAPDARQAIAATMIIVTKLNGKVRDGVGVAVAGVSGQTPLIVAFKVDEASVEVSDKRYKGTYACIASESGECSIDLVKAKRKGSQKPKDIPMLEVFDFKKTPAKRDRPKDDQLLDIYDFSKKKEGRP